MPSFPSRIFLLSPARLDGKRAQLLFHPSDLEESLIASHGGLVGEFSLQYGVEPPMWGSRQQRQDAAGGYSIS